MSTPPPQQARRSAGEGKKVAPPASSITTRNGARKAKIQTRAMSAGTKPSASLMAAKKKAQSKKKTSLNSEVKDPYQIAMDSKNKVKGPTGFVTEPRMAEHRCLWDENYPECPERLIKIIDRCQELKLIQECKNFEPRAATREELNMLHSPSVFEMMETTHQNQDLAYLERLSSKYDAVYIHPSTHELSLISAGSTIDMVDRIVSGEVQNGCAFVRPPGHHAMRAEPCGYCIYNNVALAAKHAIDNRGLSRVLIVDWDVHHGQATQQMFYDDPRVLYFSIHRYEHGAFWPNLRQSNFHYVGAGRGRGRTCNVPLNATGMRDGDYIAIWHQLLLPLALEGEMELTPACYATLLHMLMCVQPRTCVVLEGGYCIPSLAEAAALTLRTLLHHAPPVLHYTPPSDEIRDTILNCIYAQKKYWRCFNYQQTYSTTGPPNVCDGEKQKHTVTVKWEGDETRADSFATRDCYPLQDAGTKRRIRDRLNHLSIVTDLTIPQSKVSYVYDTAMLKHRNICEPGHPESPERIMRIHERHRDFSLLDRVTLLAGKAASDSEILAVHTQKHLDRLKELATTKLRDLNNQKDSYDSVYFHPDTLESATMSAGCVLQAVDSVLQRQSNSSVCIIRPPGHHADDETPSGFCLLNNAGIAARYAIDNYSVKRILILDWDVHHGNGTQRITYEDDRILYMSLHRYEHGSFFPHSKDANYTRVGSGRGEGFNVNIPWNKRGMGDVEYLAAFTQVVLPIAYEYNPELVIVSAGFDACVGDPLGGCKVTPECYGRMTNFLRGLAAGRVIICLEGGYNVTSIAYAMTMCTKALLGDPITHTLENKPCHPSAVESINNVIKTHKKYWKSLKFQLALPAEDVLDSPLPSRGLMDDTDAEKSPSLDDTNKSVTSVASYLESSIELNMANLSLDKCSDGIHCGTDDEDESPKRSKSAEGSSKKVCGAGNTSSSPSVPKTEAEVGNLKGGSKHKSPEGGSTSDVKPTLVDYLAENMQAIVDGEMFAVIPLPWCPHLDSLFAIPSDVAFRQGVKCINCEETVENWVCLHCYVTACARGIHGHMQEHYATSHHPLSLSLIDLSVWCSECDAYVDNALLYDAKNNAHRQKFHEDMPWCYASDTRGMGDVEYLAAFTQVVLPIAYEYNPELVIVSAGFDACVGDPLGGCKVTPECYGRMTNFLRGLAAGRVIICLEGGYNVTSIAYAMTMCTKALLGDPITHTLENKPCHPSAVESINNVIKTHKKYWKSLKFQLALPAEDVLDSPLPSRGLMDDTDAEKSRSLDDTNKSVTSVASYLESSIELNMANLSLDKCSDGIHCGTDDEDESPKRSKSAEGSSKKVCGAGNTSSSPSVPTTEAEVGNLKGGSKHKSSEEGSTSDVKPTLVDYLAENMQAIVDGEMFAVIPLPWCPHLDSLFAIPSDVTFRQGVKCINCEETVENWVCLHCYVTACARGIHGHMQEHYATSHHPLSLSLIDLSVWCSECDAYVDNALLYDAKNNAHRQKFHEDMPWCYASDTVRME